MEDVDKVIDEHNAKKRKYECNLCGKSYSRRSCLCDQMSKHNCDICDKDFSDRYNLKKHKEGIHANEVNGKHKCDLCDKSYSYGSGLRMHQKYAHELKIEKCPICEKNFSQLTVHLKSVHSGIKEFQCDLCPSSFVKSGDLQRHNNSKHLKRKIQCESQTIFWADERSSERLAADANC